MKSQPHYVLGPSYPAHGIWWYPTETYDLNTTGLAAVITDDKPRLTADGEVFDQAALAAAHPTIQLPAIARLTNLENGLQVTVRINDRGTSDPRRLIEITRRTAELLRVTGVARVRLQVLPGDSHAAADGLPGHPSLSIQTAPRGAVETAQLAPPDGTRQGAGHTVYGVIVADAPPSAAAPPSLRMPEQLTRTRADPGVLKVQLDTFGEYRYAAVQRARMSKAGARIVPIVENRVRQFRVEIGPLPDVATADAIVMQALASGIPDARIVVD